MAVSQAPQTISLQQLLKVMVEKGASDLHITTGSAPQLRIDGELVPFRVPALGPVETKQLCYSILTDEQKARLEEDQELDLSFGVKGLSRFRGNVFLQKGNVAGVFRGIPFKIRSFDELGLPKIIEELCNKPRGLVLITGPTGSGKSTTLAAVINQINTDRACHIITIEDPIEYVHEHRRSAVNQREVGSDTASFPDALRSALREDPDVLLVGEMRDLESIRFALTIAETGHLVFATLHTNDTAQSLARVIDVFPAEQQSQVRVQLAAALTGIVYQRLIPRTGGGMVAAYEVLVANSAVRNLIKEGKTHQLRNSLVTGQREGMLTFEQSLSMLVQSGQVRYEDAVARSLYPKDIEIVPRSRASVAA
jgi:twitching motility protein PilT